MTRYRDSDWDAVVLAGGRSTRLDGFDKTALVFEGRTLLDHALDAVGGAHSIAVIGPQELRRRLGHEGVRGRVTLSTEHPRFGGPACALARGIEALSPSTAEWTAVIAADQPHVGAALSALLAERRWSADADGLIGRDDAGRLQPLTAIYRTARLARVVALAGAAQGMSMRALTSALALVAIPLGDLLCADIDSPADAARYNVALPQPAELAEPALATSAPVAPMAELEQP